MNLKTIRDAVISIIGNDTEIQVADYNVFINEGYTNIIAKILDERKDFFPDTEDISATLGQTTLVPTKEWNNITFVQADFGNGFVTLTSDDITKTTALNPTNIFTIWGSSIIVPDFNKAFTLRIYGYVIPTALSTDGDIPAFSSLLHPLLMIWGVGRAVEASSSSENFLDGSRKRAEFWDALDLILPTVILKNMSNVKSLI